MIPEEMFPEFGREIDEVVGRKYRSANKAVLEDQGARVIHGRINGEVLCAVQSLGLPRFSEP